MKDETKRISAKMKENLEDQIKHLKEKSKNLRKKKDKAK